MRRLVLFCIVLFATTSVYAQSTATSGTGIIVAPPIALPPVPISYVNTNSVVDINGNVLIFDDTTVFGVLGGPTSTNSSIGRPTRVNVIAFDGKTVNEYNFNGSFQILGAGHNAVYAIVNSITAGTTAGMPFTINRKLVALSVVAGTLPATLPSITLASNQDVKLSAGAGAGGTDIIALISGNPFQILSALPSAATINPHLVSLYTSDGTTFTPNPSNPISTR